MMMSNPLKGEMALVFGGRTFTFRLGLNEVCTIERQHKMPLHKFFEQAQSLADIRDIVYLGLRKAHPDLDIEDLGEMLADYPNIQDIGPMILNSMREAMPHLFAGMPRIEKGEGPLEKKSATMVRTPAVA